MNPNSTDPTNEPIEPTPTSTPNPVTPIDQFGEVNQTTPVEPVVPVEPMTPTTPEAAPITVDAPIAPVASITPSPEAKKSNKKLLTILGSIVGVVLLAAIAALLYTTLSGASQEDYKAAVTQYNATSSANSAFTSDVASLVSGLNSDTDDEYTVSMKEAETSLAKLKDENKKLGDLKAVKVGEGKDLYKTFNDKLTTYVAYGGDVLESVKKARPGILACDEARSTTDSAARLAGLKNCSTKLAEVGDLPNPAFNTYIKSISVAYGDYATTYEKISALTNPLGAQYEEYKTLRDQLTAASKNLSTASKDYQTAAKKSNDEVNVKDQAQALGKYLSEQQKK